MKEIDFLPKWYKSRRWKRISYRTQCVALCVIFATLILWNFAVSSSIAEADAEVTRLEPSHMEAENTSRRFARIKDQFTELQEKANVLDEIDSKINVGNVLAELSFLINERVVLSQIEFKAERLTSVRGTKSDSSAVVRLLPEKSGDKKKLPTGMARFKVIISGVAADAGDVAELICKLEESPYFSQVYPSFSRGKKIKASSLYAQGDLQISEFEVSCYLANYRQEGSENVKSE